MNAMKVKIIVILRPLAPTHQDPFHAHVTMDGQEMGPYAPV